MLRAMRRTIVFAIACLWTTSLQAQLFTSVPKQKGHFAAAFVYPRGQQDRFPLSISASESWGLLGSARFVVDWWTLFGEPVEDYIFQWTSSGRYTIPEGPTITAEMVAKYPDLKLRFSQLAPADLEIFVGYVLEQTTGRRDCHLVPRASYCYARAVRRVRDQLIGEASGVTPMHAPGSPSWEKFLIDGVDRGLEVLRSLGYTQYGPEATSVEQMQRAQPRIVDLFKTVSVIDMPGATVSQVRWPQGEMRAIAERYRQYESGELDPSPNQVIASARTAPVTAAGGGEWNTPWSEPILAPVQSSQPPQRFGYRDEYERLTIPFVYEAAGPFVNGSAIVRTGGRVGLIARDGSYILRPEYAEITRAGTRYLIARQAGDAGLVGVITTTGSVVLPFSYLGLGYDSARVAVLGRRSRSEMVWQELEGARRTLTAFGITTTSEGLEIQRTEGVRRAAPVNWTCDPGDLNTVIENTVETSTSEREVFDYQTLTLKYKKFFHSVNWKSIYANSGSVVSSWNSAPSAQRCRNAAQSRAREIAEQLDGPNTDVRISGTGFR